MRLFISFNWMYKFIHKNVISNLTEFIYWFEFSRSFKYFIFVFRRRYKDLFMMLTFWKKLCLTSVTWEDTRRCYLRRCCHRDLRLLSSTLCKCLLLSHHRTTGAEFLNLQTWVWNWGKFLPIYINPAVINKLKIFRTCNTRRRLVPS